MVRKNLTKRNEHYTLIYLRYQQEYFNAQGVGRRIYSPQIIVFNNF